MVERKKEREGSKTGGGIGREKRDRGDSKRKERGEAGSLRRRIEGGGERQRQREGENRE